MKVYVLVVTGVSGAKDVCVISDHYLAYKLLQHAGDSDVVKNRTITRIQAD